MEMMNLSMHSQAGAWERGKNEEMGIILEDDCLPSQSFFGFARSCWRGIRMI